MTKDLIKSIINPSEWQKGKKLICISGFMKDKIVTFEAQEGVKIKISEHPGFFKKTDFRPLATADL